MIWQTKSNAPANVEVLVKWGTKSHGPQGYEIAKFDGKIWRDNRGERVETEGYEVLGWMLLPLF